MIQSKLTLLMLITTKTITFNECLLYARLYAMHLTFTDQVILLMIPRSRFYYLLFFIIKNKAEKQRFRNMCQFLSQQRPGLKAGQLAPRIPPLVLVKDWLGYESHTQKYEQDANCKYSWYFITYTAYFRTQTPFWWQKYVSPVKELDCFLLVLVQRESTKIIN